MKLIIVIARSVVLFLFKHVNCSQDPPPTHASPPQSPKQVTEEPPQSPKQVVEEPPQSPEPEPQPQLVRDQQTMEPDGQEIVEEFVRKSDGVFIELFVILLLICPIW